MCVQPHTRISPHWLSKHLHNAVRRPWSSGPWEEDGTSQGQVFPVKIPQPGLGIRVGITKVGGRGLGSEGLSRGCCLSLGKDARDASVVWGLGSREHTAFRLWGVSSVVRTAEAWVVVVMSTVLESTSLTISCYSNPHSLHCRLPRTSGPLHALCSLPGCSSLTAFKATSQGGLTRPLHKFVPTSYPFPQL